MANYRLSTRNGKEYIYIDFDNITPNEMKIVKLYMELGREAKEMKRGWTKERIRQYIEKNDKEGLKEFDKLVADKNNKFVSIISWFKKKYNVK